MDKEYIHVTLDALYKDICEKGKVVEDSWKYMERIRQIPMPIDAYLKIRDIVRAIGVSDEFKEIMEYFQVPEGELPAGFEPFCELRQDGLLEVSLKRNIAYGKNGQRRPTDILFSADSANPNEVSTVKDMIANLTCNPAIIYDRFINNPKANVGGKYKDRDEVLRDIGKILGPGCDISVELNNPYDSSDEEILEECAKFREMLSKYRVVIKVPHMGAINKETIKQLVAGNKHLDTRFNEGSSQEMLRGHNIALMLKEHGYRVNFTLMFEPYQTLLAMQAKPYFINTFVQRRRSTSSKLSGYLLAFEKTQDGYFIDEMAKYMWENDIISNIDYSGDKFAIYNRARKMVAYSGFEKDPAYDGLDAIRHNLRVLRGAHLDDTRLILCNFQDEFMYPGIDKMLMEPEFSDMQDRVVITSPPEFICKFAATPLVNTYQRMFKAAVNG